MSLTFFEVKWRFEQSKLSWLKISSAYQISLSRADGWDVWHDICTSSVNGRRKWQTLLCLTEHNWVCSFIGMSFSCGGRGYGGRDKHFHRFFEMASFMRKIEHLFRQASARNRHFQASFHYVLLELGRKWFRSSSIFNFRFWTFFALCSSDN